MKIGIVTFYGLYNYGNRLQNYAVQEILKKEGFDSETVVLVDNIIQRMGVHSLKLLLSRLHVSKYVRYSNFWKFDRRYIKTRFITKNKIPNLYKDYCAFAAGSDQIWNPNLDMHLDFYFLRFALENQRIAMVPSMAVDTMLENKVNSYKKYLNGFNKLAVREESAKDIIADLTGKSAEVLIDPTMALNRTEWKRIINCKKVPSDKYWVLYYLGDCRYNEQIKKKALENNAKLINLMNVDDDYYVSAPDMFVSLIMNADLVLTDSFHAVAFSINFNIPFYVMRRVSKDSVSSNMFSRIESLLEHYCLMDRTEDNLFRAKTIDYSIVNKILDDDRVKFLDYFRNILADCK